jgi:hypothetical protein
MAVKAARPGPVGRIKGLLSRIIYSRREQVNSSKLNQKRAKGSLPEKTPLLKKELLTPSPGDFAEGS